MRPVKIWFDILTPKQVVFFEPMVKSLKTRHKVLCTSRRYNQATHLAKIRGVKLEVIGKHGGADKTQKLVASTERMRILAKRVQRFGPDVTVSCCSPEAARVSFGLGVKHYGFTDAPHAEKAMRLSVPLLHKVLIPWVIPKHELTKFGIRASNVIQYKAIDGAQTVMRRAARSGTLSKTPNSKTILVRPIEEEAAYVSDSASEIPAIKELCKIEGAKVIVLARYAPQLRRLRKSLPRNAKVIAMRYDGKYLLENADLFVGSGGTMTSEAALFGIPTISMDMVPNYYEKYIVQKRLAVRAKGARAIAKAAKKLLDSPVSQHKKRAAIARKTMVSPYKVLLDAMRD